jgi:glutathione peroxidase
LRRNESVPETISNNSLEEKMQKLTLSALFLLFLACSSTQGEPGESMTDTTAVIDHVVQSLSGGDVDLSEYRGKAMLIVNTASKCGFTSQYEGLQELHETYDDRGLVVIGFPSNDFGGQEPGSAEQIETFCKKNYGVSFPMMSKVHAKGTDIAPIYRTLTEGTSADIRGEVRWNFTKFLVDGDGQVVQRFESKVKPMSSEMTKAIEAVLPG